VRTLISDVIVFPRGNAATLTQLSEELNFPTAKGGSQHERPSMLLRAYTLLAALLALLLLAGPLVGPAQPPCNYPFPTLTHTVAYIWARLLSTSSYEQWMALTMC
jgi:hypothetical protein